MAKPLFFFCRESGCDGAGQTLLSATALTFLEALWQERSIGEAGSSLNSMLNVSCIVQSSDHTDVVVPNLSLFVPLKNL